MALGIWRQITPKRVEAVGVLFVGSAALWEATLLRQAYAIYGPAPIYDIDEKLKLVWRALENPQSQHDFIFDHTKSFEDLSLYLNTPDMTSNDRSIHQFSLIRVFLFVVGTILIALGKFWDGAP